MSNLARVAREAVQSLYPGATVVERLRASIRHRHPTDPRTFIVDGFISPIHIAGTQTEIDTAFVPAVAPYSYEMTIADYNVRAKSLFTDGQIVRAIHPATGLTVDFQPQQLQYTNDIDQIQPIADPQSVTASAVDDLLTYPNAYGSGIDFSYQAEAVKLRKLLTIPTAGAIPPANSTILAGANPVFRLPFIFAPASNLDVYINGVLWNRRDVVTTNAAVEFRNSATGATLFRFAEPFVYDATGSRAAAVQRFRRQGNSLFVEVRVPYSFLQSAVYPIFIDPTVDAQVGVGADDGENSAAGWDNNSFNNALGYQNPPGLNWENSYRFTGITASGTIGSNTYIQLCSSTDYASGNNPISVTIKAHDADNPNAPNNASQFTSAPRTTASVNWSHSDAWSVDVFYSSPGIASVIQELVDSYTVAADAVQIFVADNSSTNYRAVRAYEAGSTKAPKIHIEYTTATGSLVIPRRNNTLLRL